LYDVRTNH